MLDCWRSLTSNWSADISRVFNEARANGPHKGIGIDTPTGSGVYAAEGGTVTQTYEGMSEGEKNWAGPLTRGNFIEIDYGGGRTARYLHLLGVEVTRGQDVSVGQLIGSVNDTGASTGPHLHYDLNVNGTYTDPEEEYDDC